MPDRITKRDIEAAFKRLHAAMEWPSISPYLKDAANVGAVFFMDNGIAHTIQKITSEENGRTVLFGPWGTKRQAYDAMSDMAKAVEASAKPEVTHELRATLGNLLDQVYQMKGLFPDEDNTIANAISDAEDALKETRKIYDHSADYPSHSALLATVEKIAGFIGDNDLVEGKEHEMSIDDAFDTCDSAISQCRQVLATGKATPNARLAECVREF